MIFIMVHCDKQIDGLNKQNRRYSMTQNSEQKINSKNLRSFENIKYATDDKINKLPVANLGVEKKSKYVLKRSLEEVEPEQENL